MTKRTFTKRIFQESQILEKERIEDYLSHYYHYLSREQWRDSISHGDVCVNGLVVDIEYQLQINDCLECTISFVEPEVNENFSIVYEDEELLIVNKPPNLPIHPSGCFYKHTLWYLIKEIAGECHFINRLDRETGGLVIVAKTKQATKDLNKQMISQKISKFYYALVEGSFPRESLRLKGYLVKDPKRGEVRKKYYFSYQELEGSKYTETKFKLLGTKKNLSLISCSPKTGRTHQIRASFEFLNFPLVGDKIYGKDERFFLKFLDDALTQEDRNSLRLPFQALQCYAYEFIHPRIRENFSVSIPLDCTIENLFNS